MTKEQYLELDIIIGANCDIDKSQKIDVKEFEFTFKGKTFILEVFQTFLNLSHDYAVKVVVADGIDFSCRDAILSYCKSRNLLIIEVFGDIPTTFVGVQDANIDTLFLEQIETY